MEIELGYFKGMQADMSPTKRDPQSYLSALNVSITSTGTYGSVTNDNGNELLFNFPTIGKAWNITLPAEATTPKINFIVNGKLKTTINLVVFFLYFC